MGSSLGSAASLNFLLVRGFLSRYAVDSQTFRGRLLARINQFVVLVLRLDMFHRRLVAVKQLFVGRSYGLRHQLFSPRAGEAGNKKF